MLDRNLPISFVYEVHCLAVALYQLCHAKCVTSIISISRDNVKCRNRTSLPVNQKTQMGYERPEKLMIIHISLQQFLVSVVTAQPFGFHCSDYLQRCKLQGHEAQVPSPLSKLTTYNSSNYCSAKSNTMQYESFPLQPGEQGSMISQLSGRLTGH